MKALKKLALVSAVSMISAGAFAMEAVDDEALSAATGQDGITIIVSPGTVAGANAAALQAALANVGVSATTATSVDANTNNAVKVISIKQVVIHDDDGYAAEAAIAGTDNSSPADGDFDDAGDIPAVAAVAAKPRSGALVIGDGTTADSTVLLVDDAGAFKIEIDMTGDADANGTADDAQLRIKIDVPKLTIKTGSISVAASNAADDETVTGLDHDGDGATTTAGRNGSSHSNAIKIASGSTISLDPMTVSLYMGDNSNVAGDSEDHMIVAKIFSRTDVSISDINIEDASNTTASPISFGGGRIHIGSVSLSNADNGVQGLDIIASVDVEDDFTPVSATLAAIMPTGALVLKLNQVGSAGNVVSGTGGLDIAVNDMAFGSTTAADIGDIQLNGLNLNGTRIYVSGH